MKKSILLSLCLILNLLSAYGLESKESLENGEISNILKLSNCIESYSKDQSSIELYNEMISYASLIEKGDFGIGNEIQQRKEFITLCENCRKLIEKTEPYYFVYDPTIKKINIDYENEIFSYAIKTAYITDFKYIKLVEKIQNAFYSHPENKNWNIEDSINNIFPDKTLSASFSIFNAENQELAKFNKSYKISKKTNIPYEITATEIEIQANLTGETVSLCVTADSNEKIISKKTFREELIPNFLSLQEIIPDLYSITLPQSINLDLCNNILTFFNLNTIESITEEIYKDQLIHIDNLVFTENESEILEEMKFSTRSNSTNIINDKYIVKSEKCSFPRIKEEFRKDAGKYLSLKFKNFGDSNFRFLVFDEELVSFLKQIYGSKVCNKATFRFYVPPLDLDSQKKDSPAYYLSEDVILDIKKSFPTVKTLRRDNFAGTSESGSYGTRNDVLKDFVYLNDNIQRLLATKNPKETENLIYPIALYIDEPKLTIKTKLPELENFINNYQITSDGISKEFYNTIVSDCKILGLNYEFTSYNNLNSELALFVNALNEICGYNTFACKEDGSIAKKVSEIHHFDYSTEGYMIPSKVQYAECKNTNSRFYKKFVKDSKRDDGNNFFIMIKK